MTGYFKNGAWVEDDVQEAVSDVSTTINVSMTIIEGDPKEIAKKISKEISASHRKGQSESNNDRVGHLIDEFNRHVEFNRHIASLSFFTRLKFLLFPRSMRR
jgi:hypothetical protein